MPVQDVLGGVERSLGSLGYGVGMVPPAPRRAAPVVPIATAIPVAAGARPEDLPIPEVEEVADEEAVAEDEATGDSQPVGDEAPDRETANDEVPLNRLRLVLDESADDETRPVTPVSVDEVEDVAFDLGSDVFDEMTADAARAPESKSETAGSVWKPSPGPVRQPVVEPLRAPRREPAHAVAVRAEPVVARERAAVTVDDDIVEIFVEEVGEVLETINEWLPRWLDGLGDETALTEVRRSFHTLKGSGRIVGASVIGELAWSVENMLNRVIDGTIPPNEQIDRVAREAMTLLPALRADFEARRASDEATVAGIMERADVLASGGTLEEVAPALSAKAAEPPRPPMSATGTSMSSLVSPSGSL